MYLGTSVLLMATLPLLNIGFCPSLIMAQDLPANSSYPSLVSVNMDSNLTSGQAITAIANSTQAQTTDQVAKVVLNAEGLSPESNLSSYVGSGSLSENKSSSGGNYDDDDEKENNNADILGQNRGMRSEKEKERMRLALLKQIQSLDHMKCFPKVLCGLSVDSSKNSKDMDSYFVRSYIQLMRSANPDDGSSEETKTSFDPKKDAISMFLMKSGLLKPKPKKRPSHSASSSEEGSDERQARHKSLLEKKNEALKSLLIKRRLSNDKENAFKGVRVRPILRLSDAGQGGTGTRIKEPLSVLDGNENPGSVTSQIGSLVSSWVPWVNLSFGKDDSFEKDPFFRGGGASKVNKNIEKVWQNNLEKLSMLMAVKDAEIQRKKNNKAKSGQDSETGRSFRDLSTMDDEIKVYSTAVDIGKKLKDTKQCDYLYNGCPVTYANIIKIIASIRKDIKESDETVESLSKEILEYSQQKKVIKQSSSKRPQPNGQKKLQNKQPMTQISHTLPNGEKVEINVQLSPKDGEVEIESPYGDSYVADEEPEEIENTDADIANQQPVADLVDPLEVDADGDDPAISASYELAGEKLEGDHRKPSPSHIFSKLNKRKKTGSTATPPIKPSTTTPTPKYIVSKKKRPATSTIAPARKPRPKPTPTPSKRRTPPTWATTSKPVPTHRPTPTGQPTVKPRSSTSRSPALKSGKRTTTFTTTFTTTTLKPKIKTKHKTTTTASAIDVESSEESTTPHWSKIAATTGILPTLKNSRPLKGKGSGRPSSNQNITPSGSNKKTSMKRPPTNDDSVPGKITIEIDTSTEADDETNNSNSSEEEKVTSTMKPISTTTSRKPLKPKVKPKLTTSTTTSTTTTPSPLSLLTQSYYDQVIADMFKSTKPPIRKTTTNPPTTTPNKRHRRPINYNKKSPSSHHGQGFVGFKNNSTTDEAYAMSVESGSGEVRPFNMAQLGDTGNPNPWTESGPIPTREPPTHDMDDPVDVGTTNTKKKRITYKNGKRPYLVLMKPGTGVRLKSPGQLSPVTMDDMNTNHNPQSSMGEGTAPLVIEPGTHSSDYSHLSPNY